jgi:hypothetical protein
MYIHVTNDSSDTTAFSVSLFTYSPARCAMHSHILLSSSIVLNKYRDSVGSPMSLSRPVSPERSDMVALSAAIAAGEFESREKGLVQSYSWHH